MKNLLNMIKRYEQKMLSVMLLNSYKIDNKRVTEVPQDSHFRKYFTKNIFDIFLISKTLAVDRKTLKFRNKFLEKLYKESRVIKRDLKVHKNKKREEMRKWDSLKFSLLGFIKGILLTVAYKVIRNLKTYLYVGVNILTYISITTKLERSFFQGAVLFWVILSFIVFDSNLIIITAVMLVFPIYIIDGVISDSLDIMKFILGRLNEPRSNVEVVEVLILLFLIFYIFILILETKKKKIRSRFKRFFEKRLPAKAKKKDNLVNFVGDLLYIIGTKIMKNFRFVALIFGLMASLVTVNLLNGGLLFLTLVFMWYTSYDSKYWIYYVYYSIFFIPLLYSTDFMPKGYNTFNVEIISIIGVYRGVKETCKSHFFQIFNPLRLQENRNSLPQCRHILPVLLVHPKTGDNRDQGGIKGDKK